MIVNRKLRIILNFKRILLWISFRKSTPCLICGSRVFALRLLDDDVDIVIVGNTANIFTEEAAYSIARSFWDCRWS